MVKPGCCTRSLIFRLNCSTLPEPVGNSDYNPRMLNVIIRPLQAPAIWLLLAWTLLGRFAVMAVDIFIESQPLAVALAVGFMAPV